MGVYLFFAICFNSPMKPQERQKGHINDHRKENIKITVSLAKKRYTIPKLYIPRDKKTNKALVGKGNLWHIYFYWRKTEGGPLTGPYTFKKGINRLKTVQERKVAGKALVAAYTEALSRGWNPDTKKVDKKPVNKQKQKNTTLGNALEYALNIKKRTKKQHRQRKQRTHTNTQTNKPQHRFILC